MSLKHLHYLYLTPPFFLVTQKSVKKDTKKVVAKPKEEAPPPGIIINFKNQIKISQKVGLKVFLVDKYKCRKWEGQESESQGGKSPLISLILFDDSPWGHACLWQPMARRMNACCLQRMV